jgi:hypothetical protein
MQEFLVEKDPLLQSGDVISFIIFAFLSIGSTIKFWIVSLGGLPHFPSAVNR